MCKISRMSTTTNPYDIPVLPDAMRVGLIVSPFQFYQLKWSVCFVLRGPFSLRDFLASYLSLIRGRQKIYRRSTAKLGLTYFSKSKLCERAGIFLACQPFRLWYQLQNDHADASDFINSLGAVTGDQLSTNSVHAGPICTVQAALLQIGATASACWSFVIAVYTFILLAGNPHWRAWAVEKSTFGKARWVLCIGIWSGVSFLGIIAPIIIQNLNPDKPPFCMIFLSYI